MCFIDIDDTIRQTYGYAKQGAGYGYSGVKGINALIGTISTPLSAPVIAATRLRKGSSNSARGAARLVTDVCATARSVGADGLVVLRADSAYYNADVVAAAHRGGAAVSITARLDRAVLAAIATIPADAWTPIQYPNAIWDETQQRLISSAEVAETPYQAFSSRPAADRVHGRLIVRRVKELNPVEGQDELFTAWRYHAVFTDTNLTMLQAETTHRQHAIIEQVIADLKSSAVAHLPSGIFTANAAWLVCAAIAFNLTRAAGTLASRFHAKATTATIRRHLITIPARIARSARRTVLHLPRDWPWAPPGPPCSPWQPGHPARPPPPDHPAPKARPRTDQWKSRTDRQTTHTHHTEQSPKGVESLRPPESHRWIAAMMSVLADAGLSSSYGWPGVRLAGSRPHR